MNGFDNVRHIISFEVFKQVEDIHDKLDKKLFGNRNTRRISRTTFSKRFNSSTI